MKTIEYKGVKYAVTAGGLASDFLLNSKQFKDCGLFKEAPPEEHVIRCMAWLKKYALPQKTENKDVGSYWLKHVIEYGDNYVINGAVIEAALRLGFDVIPCGKDSPNAGFRLMFDPEPFARALGRHVVPKRAQNRFNKAKILLQNLAA